jgi:hypothetical protein
MGILERIELHVGFSKINHPVGRGKSSCLFPWLAVRFDNVVRSLARLCTIW